MPYPRHLVLLGVVVFALTGCNRNAPPAINQIDATLRRFLNVNWLSGSITLAPGEDFYAVGTHVYEDGKLVEQSWLIWGFLQPGQSRTLTPEFLWGTLREGRRQVLACGGTSSEGENSSYWTNAIGGVSRLQPGQPMQRTPDGCAIVGYAESQLTRDGKLNSVAHGGFDFALKEQKNVGALVVRTFPTKEAQEQFMRQQKPAVQ